MRGFSESKPAMESKKRKSRECLTLENKVKVIRRTGSGESARAIAVDSGVGKTQIQNIIKNKDVIMQQWASGANANRKVFKRYKTVNDEINEKTWEWFRDSTSRNVPISGKLIQEFALEQSVRLGKDDFLASNGWLNRWQERYNVSKIQSFFSKQ